MHTEPASREDEPCPRDCSIVLAEKSWRIPVLAPRQNRIVVPALLTLIPRILAARTGAVQPDITLAELAGCLDTPTYDLVLDAVFHALTRAHPDLKRPDFDEMEIDTAELLAALPVVARQAGLLAAVESAPVHREHSQTAA